MAASPRRPAFLDITALAFSLMGFLGLISIVLVLKGGAVGVPRILFLIFLAMACAPFYVALVRPPKLPYLIPPVIAIFLMYPIGAPHGIVYSTDPIFNFSFTNNVVNSGLWEPGAGSAFAHVYSFYPVGNVFIGYLVLSTGLPAAVGYVWIEPVIRLLAMPAIVYAISRRQFGPRVSALAVLFYLGTASILFHAPVQQEMAVIFVGLSLLSLVILTQDADPAAKRRTQILFALVAGGIVMTHHLSSYIFAAWLAAIAVLMVFPRFRPAGFSVRLTALVIYFIGVLGLYIATLTTLIFNRHEQTLERVIDQFLAPEDFPITPGGAGAGLGRTFSTLEIGWLAASVLVLLLLALLAIRAHYRAGQRPFLVANGLVAAVLVIVTLPLIATSLSYVPLRIGEFTNLFIAPLAASTLIRWSRSERPLRSRWFASLASRRWLPPAIAVLISALLLMGGSLAPLSSMRIYFEDPRSRTTDSPVYFGSDAVRSAEWARSHFFELNQTLPPRIWGDQLAVDAFVGFADMRVEFGSSRIFQGTTVDAVDWLRLAVGDYVVVDSWMLVARPNFFQEPARTTNLTLGETEKFGTDPHFALVYQDATFSLYRVMSVPSP